MNAEKKTRIILSLLFLSIISVFSSGCAGKQQVHVEDLGVSIPETWKAPFPQIEKILIEEGVPTDFKYLALIESGLDNVTSPRGAKGFWQIMKTTGKEYGLEINSNVDERYNLNLSTIYFD